MFNFNTFAPLISVLAFLFSICYLKYVITIILKITRIYIPQ